MKNNNKNFYNFYRHKRIKPNQRHNDSFKEN